MVTSTFRARIGDVLTWDRQLCAVMLVGDPAAIAEARRHLGKDVRVTMEFEPADRPVQMRLGGK